MLYRRRTLRWRAESAVHALRVVVADTPRARRLGLRDPVVRACVLYARSIHTFGMPADIGAAWVDDGGFVVESADIPPNRIIVGPTVCVVEVADASDRPPRGVQLEVLP